MYSIDFRAGWVRRLRLNCWRFPSGLRCGRIPPRHASAGPSLPWLSVLVDQRARGRTRRTPVRLRGAMHAITHRPDLHAPGRISRCCALRARRRRAAQRGRRDRALQNLPPDTLMEPAEELFALPGHRAELPVAARPVGRHLLALGRHLLQPGAEHALPGRRRTADPMIDGCCNSKSVDITVEHGAMGCQLPVQVGVDMAEHRLSPCKLWNPMPIQVWIRPRRDRRHHRSVKVLVRGALQGSRQRQRRVAHPEWPANAPSSPEERALPPAAHCVAAPHAPRRWCVELPARPRSCATGSTFRPGIHVSFCRVCADNAAGAAAVDIEQAEPGLRTRRQSWRCSTPRQVRCTRCRADQSLTAAGPSSCWCPPAATPAPGGAGQPDDCQAARRWHFNDL